MELRELIIVLEVLTVLVSLIIAFYIFFSNGVSVFSRFMSLNLLDASFWALALIATTVTSSTQAGQIVFSFGGLYVPTFILFLLVFSGMGTNLKRVALVIAPPLIVSILSPINGMLFKEIWIVDGVISTGKEGPLLPFFELFYFSYVLVAIYLLLHSRKLVSGIKKVQLNYLSVGFILTITLASVTNMILPMMGIFKYGILGPIAILPLPVAMVYVASKHHILEKRVVLSEIWAFLLVLIVIATYWSDRDTIHLVVLIAALIVGLLLISAVLSESKKSKKLDEQNKLLGKAKKDLETLDRLKEEFLQSAYKELTMPISVIQRILSVIIKDKTSRSEEETRTQLQPVLDAADRLSNLSKDLFQASFIEHGRIWLDKKEADLSVLVQEAVDDQRDFAKQRAITLSFKNDKLSLKANIDKEKIYDVIRHLIENAIKFTESGEVSVGLKADGQSILIFVKDTGIGLSKEEQKSLFTKFFRSNRIDSVISEGQHGVGLGLYISKSIVELHGGTIKVESDINRGSCFTIVLPGSVDDTIIASGAERTK